MFRRGDGSCARVKVRSFPMRDFEENRMFSLSTMVSREGRSLNDCTSGNHTRVQDVWKNVVGLVSRLSHVHARSSGCTALSGQEHKGVEVHHLGWDPF